ncbi:MAG: hypothetical protein ACJ72N_28460 [Labedaea sp.]
MPRSVTVAIVLSALVAAGALGGAAILGQRAARSAAQSGSAATSGAPASTSVGVSGCLREPCQVLASTTVGGTSIELVADAGAASGRLRVGGSNSGQVIETTITDTGVLLTAESLQCAAGGPAACLIKGRRGAGVAGQVVVGRSGTWSALEKPFVSDAGHLVLGNVDGDTTLEVLAAQHDCAGADPATCVGRPVYLQVFALTGQVVGCTKNYARLDKLPGYPAVQVSRSALSPCR